MHLRISLPVISAIVFLTKKELLHAWNVKRLVILEIT